MQARSGTPFIASGLLAAGLFLAACEWPEEDTTAPPVHIHAAPAPVQALSAEAAASGMDITAIAGLPGRLPFTLPAMERAFPGHDIISVMEDPATGAPPAFHVRAPGNEAALFIVTPDWSRGLTGEIATSDPAIEGPGGIRPGVSRLSDAASALGEACAATEASPGLPPACEYMAEGIYLRLEFEESGEADPRLSRIIALPPLP